MGASLVSGGAVNVAARLGDGGQALRWLNWAECLICCVITDYSHCYLLTSVRLFSSSEPQLLCGKRLRTGASWSTPFTQGVPGYQAA